jgi:hypothetical protein
MRRNCVVIAAAVVACSVSVTEQRAVEVPGNQPAQTKVALAQRLLRDALPREGLAEKVRARFPEAGEEQLRALHVQIRVVHEFGKRRRDRNRLPTMHANVAAKAALERDDPGPL